MAKKFKDKLVEAVYNEVKASGMEKEFMSVIHASLQVLCDELIDVIRIENLQHVGTGITHQ